MGFDINNTNICYKTNFLTEVLARIDLVSPVSELKDELPQNISKIVLKHFPIDEPREGIKQAVIMDGKQVKATQEKFKDWNFYGRNKEKKLKLTPEHLILSYQKYETYEIFKKEFIEVTNEFFKTFDKAQPSRFGIRYINQIDLEEESPLDWNDYIDTSLLCLLSYGVDGAKPARIFHNIELIFDDFNLRFQFGMHNPDYPAPIIRKTFVLDYDAYFRGPIESSQIESAMDRYHDKIQSMFESNIKGKLRGILNG